MHGRKKSNNWGIWGKALLGIEKTKPAKYSYKEKGGTRLNEERYSSSNVKALGRGEKIWGNEERNYIGKKIPP